MIVYPLKQVDEIALSLQKKCGADRPVPVLVLHIARVQEVLLHKDAGVLKFFMVAVTVHMGPLGWLILGLVALRNFEQKVLQQIYIVGRGCMLEDIESVLNKEFEQLLLLPFVAHITVPEGVVFVIVKYSESTLIMLIVSKHKLVTVAC